MKIYTKTGDKGTTSLVGGTRVSKYDMRLHAYGTTDELNSWVGMVADTCGLKETAVYLRKVQSTLFDIGSNLASEEGQTIIALPQLSESNITEMEEKIDEMNKVLPVLRTFILPGGDVSVSNCHLARTVCRRAERWVVELSEGSKVDPQIAKFLNRLSDYLFVLARYVGYQKNVDEIPWMPAK